MSLVNLQGAGLGLRREMLDELLPVLPAEVDFWEVAPENWIPLGGKYPQLLSACAAQRSLTTHGLSLSIGSIDPLDMKLLADVKAFLNDYHVPVYSEHLSYCSHQGHLYDLAPIPFTEEAVRHVAERIRRVQDYLERPLVLENVSYYLALDQQLSELDFINAVLSEADCLMLLDVNNVYVNSVNHRYDAEQFVAGLDSKRIVYGHIAGHYDEAPDLKVDTHGSDVIEPVWSLLAFAYQTHGVFPTLLERDFNIPPLQQLLDQVRRIKVLQSACQDLTHG